MALATRYYTVNGTIRAQDKGSGDRSAYLPDALGSVTATTDSRGAILNTYRYKPYGELLAKTGLAADPKFMWYGTIGYERSTSSVIFSRTKAYIPAIGIWTTPDLDELTGYPITNPLSADDGCILLCQEKTKNPVVKDCGEFLFNAGFGFNKECKDFHGYVVQRVTLMYCLSDCKGNRVAPAEKCCSHSTTVEPCITDTFFEAFEIWIQNGAWKVPALDTFKNIPRECTAGTVFIDAEAGLATIEQVRSTMFLGAVPCASPSQYSSCNQPPWWPLPDLILRLHSASYACCCDGTHYKNCPEGPYIPTSLVHKSACEQA